ncbi:phosphatase [Streptomyces capparidis]
MPSRERLREHLLATRIAGQVATPRERSLRSYRLLAARDPRVLFGLDPVRPWDEAAVLRLMAARCGVSPDPEYLRGPDTIDPERTLAALDAFAARLARAAAGREPVLFGTGHPERLLGFYAALAAGLAAAGCPVLTPARGRTVHMATRFGVLAHVLDYVRAVALVRVAVARPTGAAPPAHTHSPLPVRAALGALAESGEPLPELVVGDHGWVCGAGQLGIDTVGLGDTNDPALFVGEAEGRIAVTVPLDDAVRSDYYRPLTRYVLNRACLSQ